MSAKRHKIDPRKRKLIFRDQCGLCAYCGQPMSRAPEDRDADPQFTVDHVVALEVDDEHERILAGACRRCNQLKGDLPLLVFMARYGRTLTA